MPVDLGFDSQPSSAADSLHGVRKLPDGFSLVERMNEFIAIVHAMGYSMDGCMANLEDIINAFGDKHVLK